MPLIVDASVTVAWFVRNQANGSTDRIRRRARKEQLHVPAVRPLEFANALWQLQRRKLLSGRQADTIIDLAEPLVIAVHKETAPPCRLLAIARDHDLSVYNASYLDLAIRLRYPVACRDCPLKEALRAAGSKFA